MRIGQLRDRVTIQAPTYASSTQSAQGVASWSTLADTWAAVEASTGDETLVVGSVTSRVPYTVTMRARTDVTPGMRLVWTPFRAQASRTLEVLAVTLLSTTADRVVLSCAESA